MYRAFSCDAISGRKRRELPLKDASWNQLLSAGGEGKVTIILDGSVPKLELRELTQELSRIVTLEYNGVVVYMGYIDGREYARGKRELTLPLGDLWGKLARRGAWDHGAPNVEKWNTTVVGSLAHHAAAALIRGRDTSTRLPDSRIPVTIQGQPTGNFSRSYYGYHMEMVADVWHKLMEEGLDIFLEPRWIRNGDADWLLWAGMNWNSGRTLRYRVTAQESPVSDFNEKTDAGRVTNNARRAGEGSEVDMLVRSQRNMDSPYPLLDRVTASKSVDKAEQLEKMVDNDLAMYWHPTVQWEFKVPVTGMPKPGDIVELHFFGDPWIADGWHRRRVVKVSGGMSSQVTVTVQPTGGA